MADYFYPHVPRIDLPKPKPIRLEQDLYFDHIIEPEKRFTIVLDKFHMEVAMLFDLFKAHRNHTSIDIHLHFPDTVEWVYSDWVWWKPKPETEKYFRFLNAGYEVRHKHSLHVPKAFVKEMAVGSRTIEVELLADCEVIATSV